MRFRLIWLFLLVLVGAVVSFYLATYVFVIEIPKSRFATDEPSVVNSFTEIGGKGSERLSFRYGEFWDSGVEVDRVKNGKVVWRAFVEPLGVEHSKYLHQATVSVEGNFVKIHSEGSSGSIIEQRDIKTGRVLKRTYK